jgi:hypothetical protein
MRKNNFKLGFIICLMLLLAACGNENPNTDMSSNETINNSTTDINVHGDSIPNIGTYYVSLDNVFTPPNFKIQSFNVNLDKKTNEMIFDLTYVLSSELYYILTPDVPFYMYIDLPRELNDQIPVNKSDIVKCTVPNENRLTYDIQFKAKYENIKNKNISNLKYDLFILDQKQETIHLFDNVSSFIKNN